MENIIREAPEIKNEIRGKEYFLRHECGICDRLVEDRALGLAVTERLLKAYQLEKRDVDGPGSEFDARRKALLLEIDGLYEMHGIDKNTAFMSTGIRHRRQAKRHFAELPELDAELEAAEWILKYGDEFSAQLEMQRRGGFACDIEKLMECAETYRKALGKKIVEKKKAIDTDSEDLLHKAYITAVTNTRLCETKLSAVNGCIEITGETPELKKEKSNREIDVYRARREEKQKRMKDIEAAIKNLEAEKEITGMEAELARLMEEIKKTEAADNR